MNPNKMENKTNDMENGNKKQKTVEQESKNEAFPCYIIPVQCIDSLY